jgi:hypothetical protein
LSDGTFAGFSPNPKERFGPVRRGQPGGVLRLAISGFDRCQPAPQQLSHRSGAAFALDSELVDRDESLGTKTDRRSVRSRFGGWSSGSFSCP